MRSISKRLREANHVGALDLALAQRAHAVQGLVFVFINSQFLDGALAEIQDLDAVGRVHTLSPSSDLIGGPIAARRADRDALIWTLRSSRREAKDVMLGARSLRG